ncbi:MAG: glycosyltransferase family 4 protein [Ignavibacteriales bacterium]|nr:glycosyltransferase family 4 protein [Ignavibacteriales bacterium]
MNTKPTILFTATFSTPFIQTDISILKKYFPVSTVIRSGPATFLDFFKHIQSHSITFSWFASVYSSILVMVAKLYKKKSVLILGGVDVAKMPEIKYGIWTSRWKSKIVRYGITNADVVLAVDASIKNDAMIRAGYHGKNISILPTGYDSTFWTPGSIKQDFVLTVAVCTDAPRCKVKGIDFLFDVARAMPATSFVLIGVKDNFKKQFQAPPNIVQHGYRSQQELLELYQRAAVYFQPSRREGLPNTLCEAMLCECYPVGTNVGGIPTVIGETGSLIRFGDVKEAADGIQKGILFGRSSDARKRISTLFTASQREKSLVEIIHHLAHA